MRPASFKFTCMTKAVAQQTGNDANNVAAFVRANFSLLFCLKQWQTKKKLALQTGCNNEEANPRG